jgi:hypothetical protein
MDTDPMLLYPHINAGGVQMGAYARVWAWSSCLFWLYVPPVWCRAGRTKRDRAPSAQEYNRRRCGRERRSCFILKESTQRAGGTLTSRRKILDRCSRDGKSPAENHGARLLGQSAAPFCWYGGGECGTISRALCYSLTQGSGHILPSWETYRTRHARRRRTVRGLVGPGNQARPFPARGAHG